METGIHLNFEFARDSLLCVFGNVDNVMDRPQIKLSSLLKDLAPLVRFRGQGAVGVVGKGIQENSIHELKSTGRGGPRNCPLQKVT